MNPETLLLNLSRLQLRSLNEALAEEFGLYYLVVSDSLQAVHLATDGHFFLPEGTKVKHVWELGRSGNMPGTPNNPIQ